LTKWQKLCTVSGKAFHSNCGKQLWADAPELQPDVRLDAVFAENRTRFSEKGSYKMIFSIL